MPKPGGLLCSVVFSVIYTILLILICVIFSHFSIFESGTQRTTSGCIVIGKALYFLGGL